MMRVGLFRDKAMKEVMVMTSRGGIEILADGVRKGELVSTDGLKVSVVEGSVKARSLAISLDGVKHLELRPHSGPGAVRVIGSMPKVAERICSGTITFSNTGGELLLVNEVPIEDYVAGVVQSEAGKDKAPEYYKLQAVSCRTYALVNKRKHLPEGFEVCDGVHCQVYRGRTTLPAIQEAVDETKRMVAVDASIRLIHATFHSNCGGETMNAEDLWSRSETYLVSTMDSFCLASPHATWRKSIGRVQWLEYLRKKHGVDITDSAMVLAAVDFEPRCRELYLGDVWPLVPLEQVRADWKFNSAYFTIWPNGDQVVFEGRGFGHGVGLCQEGAMRMAESGYDFSAILHHYFADVHLVDLGNIDFFRDEE